MAARKSAIPTASFFEHLKQTVVTAPAGTEIDILFVDPPNHGND